MTGPMLLEGKQLDEKRFDSEFHSELRNDDRYVVDDDARSRPISKAGRATRSGWFAKTGGEDIEFYDVATGLKAGSITTRETQMGTVTGTTVESDYKKFGNLLQPTTIKSQVGGLAAGDHDHHRGLRQRPGLGVRAAGGNQGTAQVNRVLEPGAAGLALLVLAVCVVAASTGVAARRCRRRAETFDAAWRIVRDSHFDKTLNGVDWNARGAELRPKAAAARTVGELRAVLRDMLGRLGQSHFAIIPATADSAADVPRDLERHAGFDVRLVGRDLLVTEVDADGAARLRGVQTGWKLQSIDGALVCDAARDRCRRRSSRGCCRSKRGGSRTLRLSGPSGSRANITFEDGSGAVVQLSVERRRETGQPVTVGNLPTMFVRVDRIAPRRPPAGRPE